jgi:hypothetical protein
VEGRRDRDRQRRYQRRYARRHGYFWLSCPLCGEEFGGHEAGGSVSLTEEPGRQTLICRACTSERHDHMVRLLIEHGIEFEFWTTRWGGEPQTHRFPLVAE